jgi:23S rRNA (cytidine1920-2'-O)/16S rRNA (cytidine1409-2'-O)-methyltransferase
VTAEPNRFVSRAGLKLAHALDVFEIDVAGFACADLGCNVGGFTDCLLQRSAARVCALDTAYGVLDYRLRTDERVTVCERTNALHAEPGDDWLRACDLVVIDLGWTPQRLALPAALPWLRPETGRIISLIKPHYELSAEEKRELLVDGLLDRDEAERIVQRIVESLPDLRVRPLGLTESPIAGGKSSRRAKRRRRAKADANAPTSGPADQLGNHEWLALLEPVNS